MVTMRRRWRLRRWGVGLWLILLGLVLVFIGVKYNKTRGYDKLEDISKYQHLQNLNIKNFLDLQKTQRGPLNGVKGCNGDGSTVIMVTSAPNNFIARDAIRKSWGTRIPASWNLIFYLGISLDTDVEKEVKQETNMHGDIAFGYFVDSYQNLTLKTLSLLSWVKTNCNTQTYLLKVDDDIFVNVNKLATFINCITFAENNIYKINGSVKSYKPLGDNKEALLHESPKMKASFLLDPKDVTSICHQWNPSNLISYYIDSDNSQYQSYIAAGYLYKNVLPDRNPSSKWYLPLNIYPSPRLPNFLSGTSYILSKNLITHLLTQSLNTPPIQLEDVYLTGILGSNSLKLRLSHIDGWNNFRPRWDSACVYHNLITAHGLEATELLNMNIALSNLDYNRDCHGLNGIAAYLNEQISYYFPKYTISTV